MLLIARKVKIWLEPPPIVGLNFIEERGCHSAGYLGQASFPVRGKEDSEKNGRLAAGVGSETELNLANIAGIERLCRLRDVNLKLALLNETA